MYLPKSSDHVAKKKKLVNCGVVGLTLHVRRDSTGAMYFAVDETSIDVVYGGFAAK